MNDRLTLATHDEVAEVVENAVRTTETETGKAKIDTAVPHTEDLGLVPDLLPGAILLVTVVVVEIVTEIETIAVTMSTGAATGIHVEVGVVVDTLAVQVQKSMILIVIDVLFLCNSCRLGFEQKNLFDFLKKWEMFVMRP